MEEQIQHMKERIEELTHVLVDVVCWATVQGLDTEVASYLLECLLYWERGEQL